MTSVTFSVVGYTSVRIAWVAPFNGGSPITAYSILIRQLDGITFTPLTSYCDGTSATILSNKYCDIPFTSFRSAPFTLTLDTLIVAKVAALNTIG